MTTGAAIAVRPAALADAATIAAFNVALAKETEALALDPGTVLSGVRAVFADAARGEYVVAERGGRVVGCLLITREWSDWRDGDLWWLQSVYVLPEARGAGVFRTLYGFVAAEARRRGARALRLYVERDNRRAQEVYRALGLRDAGYLVMEAPLSP